MIDIHPPQHAPMTRREFFTHLFIVILGTAIALTPPLLPATRRAEATANSLLETHDSKLIPETAFAATTGGPHA